MKAHACAACRRTLWFCTQEDGTRTAFCCAMRYETVGGDRCVLLVTPAGAVAKPDQELGKLPFGGDDYDRCRTEIVKGAKRLKLVPRDLI